MPITRWEYNCIDLPGSGFGEDWYRAAEIVLNEQGRYGWELVSVTMVNGKGAVAIFKRPMEKPPAR
jgi:hypothetical protein